MENKPKKDYNNLYQKYNHLFTKEEKRALTMFGFECGDGWYNLLEQLIDHIDSYIKHKYEGQEFDFQIVQIKEKFGCLRFYFDGGDAVIYELVRFAENQSYKICEYCGSNQNIMRSKGWIITACKPCTMTQDSLKHMKLWSPVDE